MSLRVLDVMPDSSVKSSGTERAILAYAVADTGGRTDPLTISAVACALLPLLVIALAFVDAPRSGVMLFLVPVLSLAAVVLGKVAHKRSQGTQRRELLAIYAARLGTVELLLAAILFIASVVLMPPLSVASESANRKKCASNMHLIGQSIEQYALMNGGQLPTGLDVLLAERRVPAEMFACPSSNHETAHGETFEEVVQNFRSSTNHCSVVYLGKGMTSASLTAKRILAYEHLEDHEDGMHVLYGDGNVLWLDKDEAAYIITELKAGRNPPNLQSRVRMW